MAYAFLHLFVFVSPLGQPVVETLAAAGNGAARWIAGQPFPLGPTYLGIGGLLLFLTLSVFGWDGTKASWLRTAGFLMVALLIEALAAVVLIEKTDFAASFAWSLKFRDPMGFPELWKLLKGLGVIVFPAFLFLAQLAAYMTLHFGRSGKTETAGVAAETPSFRREVSFGKPALAAALPLPAGLSAADYYWCPDCKAYHPRQAQAGDAQPAAWAGVPYPLPIQSNLGH